MTCPDCGLDPGSTVYTENRTSLKIRCSTCRSLKLPKENRNLALREADDASMEELEAAAEIWDQRVALSEKQGAADARREAMENR